MIGLRSSVAGLFAVCTAASAAQAIEPIEDHSERDHPTFVMDRCEDLASAVAVYAQVLSSNPVFGKDPSRKQAFVWADGLGANLRQLRAEFPRKNEPTVDQYLEKFGPVAVPTLVPNMPLYQSDKATCLANFGSDYE